MEMEKSKQLVITTREIVERERILSAKETEQVLIRARELAQEFPLETFYSLCEDALYELIDEKYPNGVWQIPLDTYDEDGEEITSLSVKVKNSGYYQVYDFEDED